MGDGIDNDKKRLMQSLPCHTQADDPPGQQRQSLQEAAARKSLANSSHAQDPEPQREARQPGDNMQPSTEPAASPSPNVLGWDGPLPPWRGAKAVLMARDGHNLIVPSFLADGSDIDAPSCRPLILFCPQPSAIVAIPVALRLTQEPHWQRYHIPAQDLVELLRLFSDRDSLGRLHIRVTARCVAHIIFSLRFLHAWQIKCWQACCTA